MGNYLNINGSFEIEFYYLNGQLVGNQKDEDILQGIMDNLRQGEYVIGMFGRKVFDINDLGTPLYTFEIFATDAVDYNFETEND